MSKKIVPRKTVLSSVGEVVVKKVRNVPKYPRKPILTEEELQAKIDDYNKDIIVPDELLGTPKGRNVLLQKKIKIPFNWMGRCNPHFLNLHPQGHVCRSFDQRELNRKLAEMHRSGTIPEGYIQKLLRAGIVEDQFGLLSEIFKTKSITNKDLLVFDQIAKLISPLMKVPRPEIPITTYDILVLFFSADHTQVLGTNIEKVVDFFIEHSETFTIPMFAQVCAAGCLTEHKLKQMLRMGLDLKRKVGTQIMLNVIYSNSTEMNNHNAIEFLTHGNNISELIKILQLIETTLTSQ